MKTKIINYKDVNAIEIIVNNLRNDEVAIIPCDTIYGIVARVPQGQKKLEKMKGRPEGKPFLQLATLEMIKSELLAQLDTAIADCWPGPLTVILPTKHNGAIAYRVPADPFLMEILIALGQPMYSTSVNSSGKAALNMFEHIVSEFKTKVPLIVEGILPENSLPSTIIDATQYTYKLIRQGAMDVGALLRDPTS